jgi:spore coat protein CotH
MEWYHVGVRFKGNSSLFASYRNGIDKLSFKLDFDQFEDDYPDLKDQRFYGFKQLNLKNNYRDESLMREKVAADLFRGFGLASSQVSFCTVYVDYGEGPQYFGLYSLVEEVDDTVLESQFSDETGNLYKPDGRAASFAENTFVESQMELKNNKEAADYSDIKNLYEVINSSNRNSAPDKWKTNLENVFDVDVFLRWLASNTVIQNWDTYGNMTHNYYLYNNPENYLLTWIPWDNNEAFREGKQRGALSLSLNEVDNNWPLIRYIMDTPEYHEKYEIYLQQLVDEVFIPDKLISTYNKYYTMLKEYAYAEEDGYTFINSDAAFDNAVEDLKSHVQQRNDAVNDFLQN